MLAAFAIVVFVGVGLRLGTQAATMPATFDEPWIIVPIVNLIEQGWSIRTAIDFDETKGPGLIWIYALIGEILGSTLSQLRLTSVAFFIVGALPLLDLARRCGMSVGGLLSVAVLYTLLPYQAALGQLLMSEPSFVSLAIAACWLFVWSAEATSRAARIAGAGLFAVALSVLLHNRVHAAALAPAICLVAFERGGMRAAAPWLVACAIAALSRVPLLIHWGGIVSPRFQGLHATGFRLSGMTYLLAAFGPVLLMFIPEATRAAHRWARRIVVLGAAGGLLLAVAAMPRLDETIGDGTITASMFSGVTATGVRMLSDDARLQSLALGVLSVLGGAGLAALGALAHGRPASGTSGVVLRLQFWMLTFGLGMYVASVAPVYDRYALAWTILLPIAWCTELGRGRLIAQASLILAISAYLCWRWLM